jgi:pyridoxine 5-phosphate synthase
MGNSADVVAVALEVRPHDACLVPENRHEVTTEGGLDCLIHRASLAKTIDQLHAVGTVVSLFIDPDPAQIRAAAELRAEFIELHTGAFANASGDARLQEIRRLHEGAELAHQLGLKVNAGHGLNYTNVRELFGIPHLMELNIGHSIISRSLSVGLFTAVAEMKSVCDEYQLS